MTATAPFFSIVMPTWNSGTRIEETLQSILDQDFPRELYEVICVDDGSTDGTLDRLRTHADRIQVLQQAHAGAVAARNYGNAHAKGEYLVCFDHDDFLYPFALAAYKRVIEVFRLPPVVMAEPILFSQRESLAIGFGWPACLECIKFNDYFSKTVFTMVLNSALVLRREKVLSVGGYSANAGSYDDDDILFKLGNMGPMVKILRPVTVGYRMHGGNSSRDLEFYTQGALALIRNERHGLYPGGTRRIVDRRGLIGSQVLWVCYWHFRRRTARLGVKLVLVLRLLLAAREMFLFAIARRITRRRYSSEARSLAMGQDEKTGT